MELLKLYYVKVASFTPKWKTKLVVSDRKNHKQRMPMWIENSKDIDKQTPRGSSNSSVFCRRPLKTP
eukprot:2120846-Amphidinium_carterae.1